MASVRATLLDLAIRTGYDRTVGLIDETIKSIPEISGMDENGRTIPEMGMGRTITGRTYKTLVRTGLPTSSFRNANDGVDATKGTYENRTVETFILNPRWECDKAIADNSEDGPDAFLFDEGAAIVTSAMQLLAKQFYYGTANDAKGHPGLVDSVQSAYVKDATGTSVNGKSSIWGIRFGIQDVQWVWGVNGQLETAPPRLQDITGSNGKSLTGWIQELLAYPGVQVGSIFSLCRVKNITAESGKTATDALVFNLMSQLKPGKLPHVWMTTNRVREQIRAARTATNQTGSPAPIPMDIGGIPLMTTESLVDTEA